MFITEVTSAFQTKSWFASAWLNTVERRFIVTNRDATIRLGRTPAARRWSLSFSDFGVILTTFSCAENDISEITDSQQKVTYKFLCWQVAPVTRVDKVASENASVQRCFYRSTNLTYFIASCVKAPLKLHSQRNTDLLLLLLFTLLLSSKLCWNLWQHLSNIMSMPFVFMINDT